MENYRKNNRGKSSPIVQYVVIRVCFDNSVSQCDERKPRCVSWGSESAKVATSEMNERMEAF